MKDKIKVLITISIFVLAGFLQSCSNDYPPSIYDPNEKFNPDPQITSIQPDSAFAGVDTLTITGKNFSTNPEDNAVYFNGEKGTVVSCTKEVLKVVPANILGDSIKIQVRVKNALLFAEYYPYKLLPIFVEVGGFDDYDDPFGLAVDKDENLYVSIYQKGIKQVTPDGQTNDYSTMLGDKASHMRWAPDGGIYYVVGLQYILKINPGGGGAGMFAVLPGGANDLDLDADENIYCGGGGNAIYRVKPDKSVKTVKQYPDYYINAVRVYNGYVYVGAKYTGLDTTAVQNGIWRNEILQGVDSLGATELVLDFGTKFPGKQVLSITFSADGDLYIGTDEDEGIWVMKPNGNLYPMYKGVLSPEGYALVWGNGNYLYVTRRNTDAAKKRVIRINARKKGAPYYGRK